MEAEHASRLQNRVLTCRLCLKTYVVSMCIMLHYLKITDHSESRHLVGGYS